jgi:hypothetical protein
MWVGIQIIRIVKCAANDPAQTNGCGLLPKSLNRPLRYGDWSTYKRKKERKKESEREKKKGII